MKALIFRTCVLLLFGVVASSGQTSSLTYQGKLADGGVAADGVYDITFKLFDSLAGGTQVGTDVMRDDVLVSDGIFSVELDFGAAAFADGGPRFLQIELRPGASTGAFTPLVPRQPITSAPYGVKTINATTADSLSPSCVGCVADANISSVNASKVAGILAQANGGTGVTAPGAAGNFLRSDGTNWTSSGIQVSDIPVLTTNFIQNTTTTQPASNFNISGTGSADTLNATTQYNLGGSRLITTSQTSNLFVGIGAGQADPISNNNSFFGYNSGQSTVTGYGNSFFGDRTGQNNLAGNNSFFGHQAGFSNINGGSNTFLGSFAGVLNNAGSFNSFVGQNAGNNNNNGEQNAFLGVAAGFSNTDGSYNTFVGTSSGNSNTVGERNTTLGFFANVSAPNLTYATAIGADATVSSSNTLVLGRSLDTVRVPGNLNVAGSFTGSFTVPTTNITGVLGQANGGTGLSAPGAAGNFLRSDGSNWTSSPFQASDIPVLSTSFIQNIPGIGSQSASFNITGGGTANIFNATTQYNIGGNRILSIAGPTDSNNLFVGLGAGQSNTGTENTFVGRDAGLTNNDSRGNSFFGASAGQNHLDGDFNSFFGSAAGLSNRGHENSFFGKGAGFSNSSGSSNSFFGVRSGETNTFGDHNTFVGYLANPLSNGLTNATAIGSRAVVSQSHSLVLGSIANVNGAIGDTNVGIGTTAPSQRLHVVGNVLFTGNLGVGSAAAGFKLDVAGRSRFQQNPGDTGTTNSAGFWLFQNTPNADRAFVGMENDNSVGFFGNNGGNWGLVMNTQTGTTSIRNLAPVGVTDICRNGQNEISFCSSSLRYKTNIVEFIPGMSFVNKLRPIAFDWKDGGMKDIGFGAEDIARIDPRFVTYNDKGEVEGVKYDRLTTVFVNAFREQQTDIDGQKSVIRDQQRQIEDLNLKIKLQQSQIDALKTLVCAQNAAAELCKEEK